MTKKKSSLSVGKVAAISTGVAMAGVGAYYFFGPKSKQHQKKVKTWMVEMEKGIGKKLKNAKSSAKKVV